MSQKPRSGPLKKSRGGGGMAGLGGMNLAGLGLMDIDNLNFDDGDADDIDDGDLEAELNALISGKRPKKREESKQKAAPMDLNMIQALASAAMNENVDENDSDLEGIENDDELLAELNELNADDEDGPVDETPRPTPAAAAAAKAVPRPSNIPIQPSVLSTKNTPSPMEITDVLSDRLNNYRLAEEAARNLGDNSKIRRFSRAIKTLEGQLKQAQLGKAIPEDDIPPPVAIPKPREQPAAENEEPPREPPPVPDEVASGDAPAIPPRSNRFPPPDISAALIDFDEMESSPPQPAEPRAPPPPIPSRAAPKPPQRPIESAPQLRVQESQEAQVLTTRRDQYRKAALAAKHNGNTELAITYVRTAKQFDVVLQALSEGKSVDLSQMPPPPPSEIPPASQSSQQEITDFISANSGTDPTLYNAPEQAETVLGALEQRLAKYQETAAAAKEKGESSRVRRLGRIIKEYETAIKAHKAGKPVNFEELPAPPGFGPIPNTSSPPASKAEQRPDSAREQTEASVRVPPQPSTSAAAAAPAAAPAHKRAPAKRQMSTTMEKQRQFLLERQRLFKEAAKDALKNGASKEQAMEYLRMMKGIGPMLQATESGLPVDINSIPVPPQLQTDFVVLDKEECDHQLSTDSEDLYRTLEKELEEQYQTCVTNKEHFFKLGDVGSGTKFEKLSQDTQKDLNVLKVCWKRGDPMPKFRYEDRVFTIVRHNHDVAENVMQVSVLRGITLPGKPNELDTYVKVDFAYPSDAPQSQRCHTVKNTTNPEYNFTCGFEVSRKSRSFLRALKRVQLKIEVWSKRGFLRADGLLGVVSVKLVDLETKCDIHEAFPLLDGRRDTGGKLEVKIRVSEPFVAKEVEEIKKRWLVIG